MPGPASPLHRSIISARRAAHIAQGEYEFTLSEVQEKCRHADLVERAGKDGLLGYRLPTRLCRRCKLEERAWSWGPNATTQVNHESVPARLTGPAAQVSDERFDEFRNE